MRDLLNIIVAACFVVQVANADEALTLDERIVALTLLGEARGEGERGMFAVACVIQRRAENGDLSAARVCRVPYQFSVWNAGKGEVKEERELYDLWKSKSSPTARRLAKSVCDKKIWLADITNQADHYYSKKYMKKPPYWAFKTISLPNGEKIKKPIKPVAVVGNHVFYKLCN